MLLLDSLQEAGSLPDLLMAGWIPTAVGRPESAEAIAFSDVAGAAAERLKTMESGSPAPPVG